MWEPQGLYSKFILKQPTLLLGLNAIRGLRNYPCSRIAVIYGKGLSEECRNVIEKAVAPFELKFIAKSWAGEPVLEELQPTIKELECFKPDVILAVGGGAVIDGAKITRLYYEFPFFDIASPKFPYLEWKTKFIAIPTTVGSGAEISSAAVLLNKENCSKEMIVCHALLPDVVILDPQYVKGASEKIIISSALDAVAHITEGYVSIFENELADNYAEKGLANLFEILSKEGDYSLGELNRLQFAGYLGGIVQNHCIVGAAHAIGHQLAGYGFGHAEAISLVLDKVIKANSQNEKTKERYELLARRSGIGDFLQLLNFIESLKSRLKLNEEEIRMKDLITEMKDSQVFIENIQKDKGGKGNPIPLTVEYVQFILNSLL